MNLVCTCVGAIPCALGTKLGDFGTLGYGRKMLRLLFCSGKLVPFAFGFGGRRCDGGCVGGAVDEEAAVGNIWLGGGVGRGGSDGTRGLGGSEGNASATEGDGKGVRFAMMSGANRCWRTSSGEGDGEIFLST